MLILAQFVNSIIENVFSRKKLGVDFEVGRNVFGGENRAEAQFRTTTLKLRQNFVSKHSKLTKNCI